jgi:hypothetical protein
VCTSTAHTHENSTQQFELSVKQYLKSSFSGQVPKAQRIWIRGKLKERVEKVLQHRVGFLRTKYWQEENRTVWILDEIGKEKPITIGVTIENRQQNDKENSESIITDVTVLAFRESRGWEIKHNFFTRQFAEASLKHPFSSTNAYKKGLNKSIDGISGATLSVRAVKKIAEIALILDQEIRSPTITVNN